jgi:predicted CXXCH cytochrome family protein
LSRINPKKGEKRMKKTLLTLFVLFLSVVLTYGLAHAISGVCSNCHTMHNSQNGTAIDSAGPNNYLLNAGCVACHTAATGETSTFGAPAVLHTSPPSGQGGSDTLAGGDFYWVNGGDSAKGHNVDDLPGVVADDSNLGKNPPGFDAAATSGFSYGQINGGASTWSTRLTCAGTNGCHGSHAVAGSFNGIKTAHHGNTDGPAHNATSPTTVGNSYRFLGAIKGTEDANWNYGETSTQHNEYFGQNNTADRSAGANYGTKDTISFLCAECHGVFHGTIDGDSTAGSPWVRHPTDIALPQGTTEYAAYTTYSLEAPVARTTLTGTPSSDVGGSDIVMCLSCHRAHGSNQNDLLRWQYTNMVAGDSTKSGGCFTCHTTKND